MNARPFFAAAKDSGPDFVMQLCGQGYPLCRDCTAEQLVALLLEEADAAVQRLAD